MSPDEWIWLRTNIFVHVEPGIYASINPPVLMGLCSNNNAKEIICLNLSLKLRNPSIELRAMQGRFPRTLKTIIIIQNSHLRRKSIQIHCLHIIPSSLLHLSCILPSNMSPRINLSQQSFEIFCHQFSTSAATHNGPIGADTMDTA